jgi:hypothetical protein
MTGEPLHIGPETPTAVVGTFRSTTEARLVQSHLNEAGIRSVMVGGPIADNVPMFTGGAGAEVKLVVHADDLERARQHLPQSVVGRGDEVERLDREFKRGLAKFLGLAVALAGATAGAAALWGDYALYGGITISAVVLVVWVLTKVERDDDEDELDRPAPPGPAA